MVLNIVARELASSSRGVGRQFQVRKITYENERVPLDFTVDWEAGSALVTALARSIESKSNAWKYEKSTG